MDLNRGERLQIMLTQDEVKALDDWRFAKRMPSRASAIRELLRVGLAAEGVDVAAAGVRSKDFGVVAATPKTAGKKRSCQERRLRSRRVSQLYVSRGFVSCRLSAAAARWAAIKAVVTRVGVTGNGRCPTWLP